MSTATLERALLTDGGVILAPRSTAPVAPVAEKAPQTKVEKLPPAMVLGVRGQGREASSKCNGKPPHYQKGTVLGVLMQLMLKLPHGKGLGADKRHGFAQQHALLAACREAGVKYNGKDPKKNEFHAYLIPCGYAVAQADGFALTEKGREAIKVS